MDQEAIELAIAELDTESLSRELQIMLDTMDKGWKLEVVRSLLMLTLKQKELIRILRKDIHRVKPTLENIEIEQKFFPLSKTARPIRRW